MAGRRQTAAAADDGGDELLRLALALNLTALPEALPMLLEVAEKEGLSYTDFALRMLRSEREARRTRRMRRNLKRARLGVVEGLEGFDFSLRPRLQARVVRELEHCRWVEERRNIICVGRPGTGKTRVLKALCQAAALKEYRVLYVNTADMLAELHAALADGSFPRIVRRYVKPDVLAMEEFGYQDIGQRQVDYLFRVVSARHQTASTLVAANTGFGQWKRFFPSEAQAVATVDRLIDRATILRFTGKGCRAPRDIYGAELDDES
jgi:DNA replication protein DnaC